MDRKLVKLIIQHKEAVQQVYALLDNFEEIISSKPNEAVSLKRTEYIAHWNNLQMMVADLSYALNKLKGSADEETLICTQSSDIPSIAERASGLSDSDLAELKKRLNALKNINQSTVLYVVREGLDSVIVPGLAPSPDFQDEEEEESSDE